MGRKVFCTRPGTQSVYSECYLNQKVVWKLKWTQRRCHWAFQEAEVSLDFERRERHFRRKQLLLQRRGGRKAPG